jgi:hypothetical protein
LFLLDVVKLLWIGAGGASYGFAMPDPERYRCSMRAVLSEAVLRLREQIRPEPDFAKPQKLLRLPCIFLQEDGKRKGVGTSWGGTHSL